MPKGTNQKLKLYYLSRIMTEKTDDKHHITMPEIQRHWRIMVSPLTGRACINPIMEKGVKTAECG